LNEEEARVTEVMKKQIKTDSFKEDEEEVNFRSRKPEKLILSKKGFELKERIEALTSYHVGNIMKKIKDLEG
jgi:hypothetical protein